MQRASDLTLLDAWRSGDRAAGNALLERHFSSLLGFFASKVGPDADDLIQRTLLACAESYQRLRDEASFRTYLFTIARHELYRYYRQRSQRHAAHGCSVSGLLDLQTSATGRIDRRERLASLAAALEQLPLDDKILLELFYVENLDSRALAEVFEIEPSSVRARLHRGRSSIVRLMDR
jgi:RNA polymerase sigma-70 factor (ECF subfamily)